MEEKENEVITSSVTPEPKPTKKSSALPIIIVLVLLLGVGGYFLYTKVLKNSSPKDMFISSIEKTITKASNIKEKSFNTLSDEFTVKAKITSPFLDQDLLDIVNNMAINGKVEFDKKNNTIYTNISGTYAKENLIKLSAYMEDSSLYMMFDDVFNKWIKMDLSEMDVNKGETAYLNTDLTSFSNIDLEKYEKLGDTILDVLKGSLKDSYFEKEKFDDGYKLTLTIDKNNIKDIITDFLKGLKDSKDFKSLYKDLAGEELKSADIDEAIKSFKDIKGSDLIDGEIIIKVYTNSKGELKKLDMTMKTGGQDVGFELEQSDDTIEFAIKTQGIKYLSGSISTKEKGDSTTTAFKLSLMEMFVVELNVEETIKYDAKLDKVDVSNSIDSDKLTEKDLESFEKLANSKGMEKLINDISKLDLSDMMSSFGLDETSLSF